jgi:hypothetical protein
VTDTKFHTHTKQQATSQFDIVYSLYSLVTNGKTKDCEPQGVRRFLTKICC